MKEINVNLIAPCGINCGVCVAYLREKNKCPGCNFKPTKIYCQRCKIKNCTKRKGNYCYECSTFPCDKLKKLDKRYRTKYNMSEIENLETIRDKGIEKFIESQHQKYLSNKGTLCVHNKEYYP